MIGLLIALAVGMACGGVFAFFALPAPAPPSVQGVLGVAGVALGYWLTAVLR